MAETVKKTKAPAKPRKTAASKAAAKPIALVEDKKIAVGEKKPTPVTHEEISKLAHRFWAERGHQHGSPEQDWLRAEQELRGKAS